jgi:hypothetical protein
MMILRISILYVNFYTFSCTLSQSLQSLTLTKSRMQSNLGRIEYTQVLIILPPSQNVRRLSFSQKSTSSMFDQVYTKKI